MSYIVVTPNKRGELVPLRGTIWAFEMDRATQHETQDAAQAALNKAKQFMPASVFKASRIVSA